MLWAAINFVLFVALLVRALRTPIRDYFAARTGRLIEALETGARARREAEAVRVALRRDVEALPQLRARLRADMLSAAEGERTRLLRLAREAVDRLRSDTRLLSEQQLTAARSRLRAEVIEEAVRQATALVREALRPDDQERLVRDFIAAARAA